MTMVCRGGVLLSLLVALFTQSQVSVGQECEWDLITNHTKTHEQGPDRARQLAFLPDIKDAEGCQGACCEHPECQVAMIGTPADDGTPQCFLLGCMVEGKDVCDRTSDSQFRVYRKKAKEQEKEKAPLKALGNEAPTVEDKKLTNEDKCRLPKYVGLCRAAFPKYYYDVTNQSCKLFTYGGCGANGNNFDTREECETACSGVTGAVLEYNAPPANHGGARRVMPLPADDQTPVPVQAEDESEPKSESSPPESEPTTSQSAVPAEDPVSSSPKAPLPEMTSSDFAERCEAGPEVGLCRAAMRHWYYDSETRTCKPFIYGGCGGNKNNYVDEQSCMAACTVTVMQSSRRVPVDAQSPDDQDYQEYCAVASDSGPCRAAFSMFYYEPSTSSCQSFIYGGCRGNNNRYGSLEDCMARCSGQGGWFEEHGRTKRHWTPAPFFLVATLAVISALLLAALVLITLRRSRLRRQPASSISDKQELLPDPDEQSSVESLSVQGSPKAGKA